MKTNNLVASNKKEIHNPKTLSQLKLKVVKDLQFLKIKKAETPTVLNQNHDRSLEDQNKNLKESTVKNTSQAKVLHTLHLIRVVLHLHLPIAVHHHLRVVPVLNHFLKAKTVENIKIKFLIIEILLNRDIQQKVITIVRD